MYARGKKSCCNIFNHDYSSFTSLSAPEFSFQTYTHATKKTGARKWSRNMAPVSAACVMGISYERAVLCLHRCLQRRFTTDDK